MKYSFGIASILLVFGALVTTASAHVIVRPGEVKPEAYQTFTVSVPVEREVPTTAVRLLVPEGLQSVRPNVKPGWNVNLVRTGSGEEARISEIVWSGGSIPADFREEFFFSAKTPTEPTTLQWKVYQTYRDGFVAAWDQSPHDEHSHTMATQDHDNPAGPYSETKVDPNVGHPGHDTHMQFTIIALVIALAAFVVTVVNTVYLMKKA
jgi:uncharacterized protein YcnI